MARRLVLSVSCLLLCGLLLSACGGGGPRKRVFPPAASVQELTVLPDGTWSLAVRLQNFSNVSQRFASIDAALRIGGHEAGAIRGTPDLTVGPESVEIVVVTLAPSPDATAAVRAALDARRSVRYALAGDIASSEPDRRRDDFIHESQLTPVPGLSGVLR
ncbi:hypothetical protein [Chiayiivirga flava]|uniref:Late embryogenesis abundant protein LEA-2 subgroup domain-containing protein n=1 Tax=Chiayiivirga flava TaxID=659595 RepID=A0A7W8G149_9GAMM|nr:hypothetical protein [Chiayiivirga flava]MBB5207305.1 hypothetical protein [Chiayiivirga flava]